jgi:hypothetical protein
MHMHSYYPWAHFVSDLEEILKANGITILPGSPFEEAKATLHEMDSNAKRPVITDPNVDQRERWRRALSFADLAEKIVFVRDHPDFKTLLPHLELLAKESDLSQFSWTPKEAQDNNKTFELYVATMCLPFMTGCTTDHPEQSNGGNPDVMGLFNGKRWAVACKAMHSTSPKTFFDRVKEGIDQIERCATAERGIVVVNMKNTVDHGKLWPVTVNALGNILYGTFPSIEAARQPFIHEFEKLHQGLITLCESEVQFYLHLFKGKKASPYIFLIYASVTGINEGGGEGFLMFRSIASLCCGKDAETEAFAGRLNTYLQNQPNAPIAPGVEL